MFQTGTRYSCGMMEYSTTTSTVSGSTLASCKAARAAATAMFEAVSPFRIGTCLIRSRAEISPVRVIRFLCVSTVGVYPKECKVPTPEEDGFKGEPESSGFGYGWSKRQAEVQARCYREEYGMKITIVRPYNIYGPRMDFNLETVPVVSSQIRNFLDAKDVLTVWGDGEQTRSFTYVSDEVAGMLLAVEKYPEADPLNIDTSEEIKIKDLVRLTVRLSGKDLQIRFDTSKPSGAARRCPDISKAARLIGYQPKVWMEEGARRTMDWYQESILASQ